MLIAIAIVAVIALLGYRAVAALSSAETQLATEAARWRALDLFLARLEGDMRAAVPRTARSGSTREAPWLGFVADAESDGGDSALTFSRAGPEFQFEAGSAGQRLGYRLRDGNVEVLYWASYDRPQDAQAATYALLGGITRFHLSYLARDGAWVDAWPVSGDSDLPRAARVQLTLVTGEAIERWIALAPWSTFRLPGPGGGSGAGRRLSWQCCWQRSQPPSPRHCCGSSSAGSETINIGATRSRLRHWRWPGVRMDPADRRQERTGGIGRAPQPAVGAEAARHVDRKLGSISGYIVDVQGQINVNNLAQTAAAAAPTRAALQRLLSPLGLSPNLVNSMGDWVDSDDSATDPGGAEDAWYLAQNPPGLAANAPARRVGELLLVRGMNGASMDRLRGFVTALDAPTKINLNTAPPEVLAASVPGLDAEAAAVLVASRAKTPFASMDDFRARLSRPDMVVDETSLDVRSDWFEVSIEARQGDTVSRARALLKRAAVSGQWPIVVWQIVE